MTVRHLDPRQRTRISQDSISHRISTPLLLGQRIALMTQKDLQRPDSRCKGRQCAPFDVHKQCLQT
eukprot:2490290-Amphidinium_carterae.1